MSAFEVGAVHIDALLTAGLVLPRPHGPLRWLVSPIADEDRRDCYATGQPWGPRAIELYNERVRELTPATAGSVGAMLVAENRRSLDWRYDEFEIEDPYEFHQLRGHPDPLIVLKAVNCYRYQACEHPDWLTSQAFAFCEALEGSAISSLPGYDTAPGWEVRSRDVFQKAAVAR